MKSLQLLLGVLLLSAISASGAKNATPHQDVVGIYSDLHLVEDEGDLIGIEIWIVPSKEGYSVIFQSSEGWPDVPVVARITIAGPVVQFTVPGKGPFGGSKFSGRVTKNELIGRFDRGQQSSDGHEVFHLKRGKSFWSQR